MLTFSSNQKQSLHVLLKNTSVSLREYAGQWFQLVKICLRGNVRWPMPSPVIEAWSQYNYDPYLCLAFGLAIKCTCDALAIKRRSYYIKPSPNVYARMLDKNTQQGLFWIPVSLQSMYPSPTRKRINIICFVAGLKLVIWFHDLMISDPVMLSISVKRWTSAGVTELYFKISSR